jgi:hypothetical protein
MVSKPASGGRSHPQNEIGFSFRVILGRLTENPLAGLTVVGVVLYGILRLSAALFYLRLGVTPEDVGLSYSRTISQAFFGLIFFAAYFALSQLFMPALLEVGRRMALTLAANSWPLKRGRAFLRRYRDQKRRSMREVMRRSRKELPATVFGIILGLLVLVSWSAGGAARNGEPQHPSLFGLSWRAEAARVSWVVDPPASSPIVSGACVLLLGAADGVYVVYEPVSRLAYRLPIGNIIVETGPSLDRLRKIPPCGRG